jgi:hypothetical protein
MYQDFLPGRYLLGIIGSVTNTPNRVFPFWLFLAIRFLNNVVRNSLSLDTWSAVCRYCKQ